MKKKPSLIANLNITRRLGVEIECTIPVIGAGGQTEVQKRIAEILTANNLRAFSRGYSRSPIPANADIVVEYDTSIDGSSSSKYAGMSWAKIECKTRILEGYNDYLTIIPQLLSILKYCGARVNHSTGLHVHLDLSSEIENNEKYPKSLLNIFYRFQDVLHGVVAPSRKGNRFSRPIPDMRHVWNKCKNLDDFRGHISSYWSRYIFLNLTHLWSGSHRVEIRMHHGTLDPKKVNNWIVLLNRMLDHAALRTCQSPKEIAPNNRRGMERLLTSCGLKRTTGIYEKIDSTVREAGKFYLARWKHFNQDQELALKPTRKQEVE